MFTAHQGMPGISKSSHNPPSSRLDDDVFNQVHNEILLALPRRELDLVLPHLEFVRLTSHHVLHAAGATLTSGYFCNAGMFSQQVVMSDGA